MGNREIGWFKSSYSGGGNDQCVECRIAEDAVGVRDSKNRRGPAFAFGSVAWRAFIGGAKAGAFDRR
ncbi:DUF397 domain-containing protein [Solihabitans fulvus]|uniref:DUF397 domain-containing protein n=1 Tax=Solihabitans fulvus TaxID=1892852 RepID=A0A5B2WHC5_9PSEU|nr:DUF397 domain-containing protein [Solihabitans fulvus]KAA2250140.1 DUF397 domain-containing protein [Solihabitans fulvus]